MLMSEASDQPMKNSNRDFQGRRGVTLLRLLREQSRKYPRPQLALATEAKVFTPDESEDAWRYWIDLFGDDQLRKLLLAIPIEPLPSLPDRVMSRKDAKESYRTWFGLLTWRYVRLKAQGGPLRSESAARVMIKKMLLSLRYIETSLQSERWHADIAPYLMFKDSPIALKRAAHQIIPLPREIPRAFQPLAAEIVFSNAAAVRFVVEPLRLEIPLMQEILKSAAGFLDWRADNRDDLPKGRSATDLAIGFLADIYEGKGLETLPVDLFKNVTWPTASIRHQALKSRHHKEGYSGLFLDFVRAFFEIADPSVVKRPGLGKTIQNALRARRDGKPAGRNRGA